jgi:hypothetical protein
VKLMKLKLGAPHLHGPLQVLAETLAMRSQCHMFCNIYESMTFLPQSDCCNNNVIVAHSCYVALLQQCGLVLFRYEISSFKIYTASCIDVCTFADRNLLCTDGVHSANQNFQEF